MRWIRCRYSHVGATETMQKPPAQDGFVGCLLWVICGRNDPATLCPLFPPKQTFANTIAMSAKCQKLPYAPRQLASLFNHLIRPRQQRRRHRDAEGAGGLEVYDEFVF